MDDGSILLSYGNRGTSFREGEKSVDVRVSLDKGKTWSLPKKVVEFRGDGGYPSTVRREDGALITAYYAEETDYHDRYHMGVVIWDYSLTDFKFPYEM